MSKLKYANSLAWRMAIVLLIAVFCVAGVISCSGAPTQSASLSSSGSGSSSGGTTDGGTTDGGSGTTDDGTITPSSSYPADTYYTVKVPFATSAGFNATMKVSYQDQETLNKLWKAMIRRQGMSDGNIFFIANRGGHNGGSSGINKTHNLKNGDMYYYFLNNMNICYQGTVLKKFEGAVIIPYANQRNTYTVGGVYRHVPQGQGYRWLNSDGVNIFMGWYDSRVQNDLDVVVLNTTKYGREFNGYGVDVYYKERNKGVAWGQNLANFLGHTPGDLIASLPKIEHFNHIGGDYWYEMTFEAGSDPSGWGRGK